MPLSAAVGCIGRSPNTSKRRLPGICNPSFLGSQAIAPPGPLVAPRTAIDLLIDHGKLPSFSSLNFATANACSSYFKTIHAMRVVKTFRIYLHPSVEILKIQISLRSAPSRYALYLWNESSRNGYKLDREHYTLVRRDFRGPKGKTRSWP
jgi:hypothetical protein